MNQLLRLPLLKYTHTQKKKKEKKKHMLKKTTTNKQKIK